MDKSTVSLNPEWDLCTNYEPVCKARSVELVWGLRPIVPTIKSVDLAFVGLGWGEALWFLSVVLVSSVLQVPDPHDPDPHWAWRCSEFFQAILSHSPELIVRFATLSKSFLWLRSIFFFVLLSCSREIRLWLLTAPRIFFSKMNITAN